MGVQPQRAGSDGRINPGIPPPRGFVAATMHLAMVSATQWNSELIAVLAPECPALGKSQVVGIRGSAATNETSLSSCPPLPDFDERLCWNVEPFMQSPDHFERERAPAIENLVHSVAATGRLLVILLTGGEAHDCPIAERLIRRVKRPKRILGDKAYDSAELRQELDERGTKPVIPNRCNRKQPFSLSKRLYKLQWRIENAFNRLKDFRRIATRYDRLARNYLASVCLAAALVWWI